MDIKDGLAIWGALLSSALAAIKIAEWWRDRARIDISYSFSSDELEGNTIFIRNLSNRQFILDHWEVFSSRDQKGEKDYRLLGMSEPFAGNSFVGPYSSHALSFTEENYFSTSAKAMDGKGIFIKLYIAGRDPKTYRVGG